MDEQKTLSVRKSVTRWLGLSVLGLFALVGVGAILTSVTLPSSVLVFLLILLCPAAHLLIHGAHGGHAQQVDEVNVTRDTGGKTP